MQHNETLSNHLPVFFLTMLKFAKLRWRGSTKFNLLTTNVPHHKELSLHHMETSLNCIANQLTGFHMMGNTGRYWVNKR